MPVTFSAFCEALLTSLQTVVNRGNTAVSWQVHSHPAIQQEPAVSSAPHLVADLTLSGGLAGILALSLPQTVAFALLGKHAPDYTEPWLALVRSVGEHLCATLSAAAPSFITLEECTLSSADQHTEPLCAFELTSLVAETSVALLASGDHALLAQLQAQPALAAARARDTSAAPLHRVIDVPLAVTLRFGQRHLTLREVLDLNPGSLLELDRHVEDPVDLMLGDRIIARGEVVIIDGNYGMRVTEVVELPTHALGAAATPSAFAYVSA